MPKLVWVSVSLALRSRLPVSVHCQGAIVPLTERPRWAARVSLSRRRPGGVRLGRGRPRKAVLELTSNVPFRVAWTVSETARLIVPLSSSRSVRGKQGAEAAELDPGHRLRLDDVALALEQGLGAAELGAEVDPAGLVDLQVVELGAVGFAAAVGGEAALDLGGIGVEAAPEDEVHHPLVGPIAIFEGDLLGHDVDPDDRLGRDVADLARSRRSGGR